MQHGNWTFVRSLNSLQVETQGSVVSVGSFDGVHRGHQAVLRAVVNRAEQFGLTAVAMTFEPQPREFFAEERAPARLMRLREKIEALVALGLDRIVCLQFNRALRGLSADEFIVRVLVDGLRVKHLIVGDDFRFGCDRSGDLGMLCDYGKRYNFTVQDTQTLETQGERISSTLVRKTIEQGDFQRVAELIGRPFSIKGRVVHGQQLGRKLGFPTANVQLHRYRAPLSGVFAVYVTVANRTFVGAANVGVRPTIGEGLKPLLEVHLLDFSGDLYGQFVSVEFVRKIRDEKKFNDLEDLACRIRKDIQEITRWFAKHQPRTANMTPTSQTSDTHD